MSMTFIEQDYASFQRKVTHSKTLGIYRPQEIKEPYIVRHLETFITELTNWEDFDDDRLDENQRIGFKLNVEQEAGSQQ